MTIFIFYKVKYEFLCFFFLLKNSYLVHILLKNCNFFGRDCQNTPPVYGKFHSNMTAKHESTKK